MGIFDMFIGLIISFVIAMSIFFLSFPLLSFFGVLNG